jgi:hypothetical protein
MSDGQHAVNPSESKDLKVFTFGGIFVFSQGCFAVL